MALKPCRECGKEVSTEAPACPHCGAKEPTGAKVSAAKAGCLGCFGLVVVLGIIGALAGGGGGSSPPGMDTESFNASAPAATGPELELVSFTWSSEYGYATLEGQVRNISDQPLEDVMAVATFYDASGNFITTGDALIDYNPILPGQTSPFSAMATHNPAMSTAGVEFKHLMGGTILTRERSTPPPPAATGRSGDNGVASGGSAASGFREPPADTRWIGDPANRAAYRTDCPFADELLDGAREIGRASLRYFPTREAAVEDGFRPNEYSCPGAS